MKDYVAITTRREFQIEAENIIQATQKADSVLNNEQLIIICDPAKAEIQYTAGIVKAKR